MLVPELVVCIVIVIEVSTGIAEEEIWKFVGTEQSFD